VIRDGRLIGAMLVGNTAATGTLIQHFDRDEPLPDDPLEVLCQPRATRAPAARLVCSCHKVTEATLVAAAEAGADSVAALGEVTKAGTGCGSCKVELEEIARKHGKGARSLPTVASA